MRTGFSSHRRERLLCVGRRKRRVVMAPLVGRKTIRPSIEGRLKKLQRIVPGCQELDVDALFQRTADYILALELQVSTLKSLILSFGP
uniref:Uncharacterized protein n=1 Tax=Nelumbo nucifera TaxID=4432 RepID=A0A822Y5R3_NELNU|nr:TPA_asm: hypothetical protein HUJ06_029040 [Nelumbo nucifera]